MFGFLPFTGFVTEDVSDISFNDIVTPGTRVPSHRVYIRSVWADDWVLTSYLYCNWFDKCLSPNMPMAEIEWRYGWKLNQATGFYEEVAPYNGNSRFYVKIVVDEWETGFEPLVWYGILGSITAEHGGLIERDIDAETTRYSPTGVQVISCTGLEKMLLDTPVTMSYVWDDGTEEIIPVRRGITFNAPLNEWRPGGNRSQLEHDGTYLFSNTVREDEAFWNMSHIVQYLIRSNRPLSLLDNDYTDWIISDDSVNMLGAGVWRPVVETHGRFVKDILDQLITPGRLLAYHVRVTDDNEIELAVESLSHKTLAEGSNLIALPNANKVNVDFDFSQGQAVVYTSHHEPVDHVRVYGAKARVVCTLSYEDQTLVKGWTDAQETSYDAGGSALAEYIAATSTEKKRALNDFVRSQDQLKDVYSFFKLPDDWDCSAGDGFGGGALNAMSWVNTAVDSVDPELSRYYQRETFLVNRLPLKYGYNYTPNSGEGSMITPTLVSAIPHLEMPILVYIQATNEKFYQVEKIGLMGHIARQDRAENFQWSGSVIVPERERGFYLTVTGEPQHIIAKTDFTPLSEDRKTRGYWDWKKMVATVAVELAAYCEGNWPPKNAMEDLDYMREITINAGEEYKLDWLNPYTIVGINSDGTIQVNSTGGYINNDVRKLTERAKVAYEWYADPRAAFQLRTLKIADSIPIGSLVRYFGGEYPLETNCVVTSVRVDIPSGTVESPPGPIIQTYTTDFVHSPEFF